MSPQLLTILIAILVFGAGLLVLYGIQSSKAKASTPEMESRLERYGHIAETNVSSPKLRPGAAVTGKLDSALKGKSFAETTATAIARADLRMTIGEFMCIRVASAAVGFLLGALLGRSAFALMIVFGIAVAALGWAAPSIYLSMRAKRRQKAFLGQLGDTIGLMANSLRAGYSLLQTMELIAKESPHPMNDEFRRVVREVGLGITPQQALNNLLRRVPSEDLDLMVSAINIQHEIGGNLGQILDVIGETIRERVRIQGEISVLTSQQQLSGNVIAVMPVLLAVILFVINPDYMMQVFVWPWICLPIAATVLLVLGYLVMRKIVAIEV
jgi:tight adherence protein B